MKCGLPILYIQPRSGIERISKKGENCCPQQDDVDIEMLDGGVNQFAALPKNISPPSSAKSGVLYSPAGWLWIKLFQNITHSSSSSKNEHPILIPYAM